MTVEKTRISLNMFPVTAFKVELGYHSELYVNALLSPQEIQKNPAKCTGVVKKAGTGNAGKKKTALCLHD